VQHSRGHSRCSYSLGEGYWLVVGPGCALSFPSLCHYMLCTCWCLYSDERAVYYTYSLCECYWPWWAWGVHFLVFTVSVEREKSVSLYAVCWLVCTVTNGAVYLHDTACASATGRGGRGCSLPRASSASSASASPSS